MLKSMTGFGKSQAEFENGELNVEIRTLNSKFADVAIKLPSSFSDFEHDVKKTVTDSLIRGKISVNIDLTGKADVGGVYNHESISSTYNELKELATNLGVQSDKLLELAIQAPGSLESGGTKYTEEDYVLLKKVLFAALSDCNDFREKEGNELSDKLSGYVNEIQRLLDEVAEYEPERLSKVEERLKSNLADLESSQNVEVDKNRFEQELIYYIEKYDISEEKVRLKQHINYFLEVLEGESASGKKLGFISQEMGREINTLGSKANHANIQRLVVQMKEELEKIKEQVLNVL